MYLHLGVVYQVYDTVTDEPIPDALFSNRVAADRAIEISTQKLDSHSLGIQLLTIREQADHL